jgi:tetratricopeptide (TPR) repeat protein
MSPAPPTLAAAIAQLNAGQLPAAEQLLRAVLAVDEANATAWCFLGICQGQRNNGPEAITSFQQAIRLRPDFVEAHCNLGITLLREGQLAESEASLRRALTLRPDYINALNGLSNTLAEQGRLDDAIGVLRRAVEVAPEFVEAHINLGIRLREQSRLTEALACFDRALRLRPGLAEAHHNLAAALVELGKVEEAMAHYQEALRLRPTCAHAYFGLSELAATGHYQFSPFQRQQMQELLAAEYLGLRERISLHFVLAALHDRDGARAEAFAHYRAGNELRRQFFAARGHSFDAERHRRQVDELIASFTPAYFAAMKPFGVATELPVFIVGAPRSGTSLVEQILASHPAVFGAGELPDMPRMVAALPSSSEGSTDWVTREARLTPEASRSLAAKYLERLTELGGGALRVIDKLPENYLHLGLVFTLFPTARVIHCRRSPLDVCWSCYTQNFQGLPVTSSLEDLGHYYRQYERLMAHWRAVLPRPMLEVEYEKLVQDPGPLCRDLVAYCGLEWDDRCLAFHKTARAVRTASKLQVRQPLYRHAVGRWQRYEAYLGPLMAALGSSAAERA